MPVRLVITHNLDELPVLVTRVNEKAVRSAVVTSIRRTFQGLRANTGKLIREKRLLDTRALPISELKKRYMLERQRVSKSMPIGEMHADLVLTDIRIGLGNFFARRVQTGKSSRNAVPLFGVQ